MIFQVDGNNSGISDSSDDNSSYNLIVDNSTSSLDDSDDTVYDTDEEIEPELIPANLSPVPSQNVPANEPIIIDVDVPKDDRSSFIPLCLMMNCRRICNKADNVNEMMRQICPDLILASETWEREKARLKNIIKSKQFKSVSFYRKNKSPGGG